MNNNRGNNNRRRGRGNNNGRPQGGGRGEQLNRIDSRARGNAPQMLEKYRKLAQDAHLNGDRVTAEYYLQFADHYFRVIADTRLRQEEQRVRRDDRTVEDDADDLEFANDSDFPSFDQPVYARRDERRPQRDEAAEGEAAEGEQGYEPAGGNPFTRDNRAVRAVNPSGERRERPERAERPEPAERQERRERPERPERQERPERAERTERPERVERPVRPERAEPRRREAAEPQTPEEQHGFDQDAVPPVIDSTGETASRGRATRGTRRREPVRPEPAQEELGLDPAALPPAIEGTRGIEGEPIEADAVAPPAPRRRGRRPKAASTDDSGSPLEAVNG